MYGLYMNNELYRADFISALASLSYWMDPDNASKRAIDIFFAKFATISFFIYGHKYLKTHDKIIGYTAFSYMLSFYALSCYTYRIKCKKWYYFHFIFHTFVCGCKLLVYSSEPCNVLNKNK